MLGPYVARGKWRVIVVGQGGERVAKDYQSEAEARQVVRSLNRKIVGDERTIEQALTAYEDYMREEKGNKPRTIENNLWRVRTFFPDVEEQLVSLTPKKCQTYYDQLRVRAVRSTGKAVLPTESTEDEKKKLVSVDTHRGILDGAKTFLTWCGKKKWVGKNPLTDVKGIGKRRHGKEQLRIDEARKWKAKALEMAEAGDEGAVAALVALVMGLRASEIVGRVVRDLDDEGRLLWIPESKTEAGRRRVEVPELMRPLLLELAEAKKPEDLLFGYHYRDWVRDWVHRICVAAGVPKVTAHGMRGLHGTISVEAGVTGHVVAAALGHESEAISYQSYVKPSALESSRQRRLMSVLASPKSGEGSAA